MIEVVARSVEQTHEFAARLAQALAERVLARDPESVLITLNGPLGAGKTELVRGFMAGLDPARQRDVSSPTYAIVNIYEGRPVVRHMDLYRLETLEDLEGVGYRDCYLEPGIALVEWAEKVPEALPRDRLDLDLEPIGPEARQIRVTPYGVGLTALLRTICV